MNWLIEEISKRAAWKKVRERIIPNLKHVAGSTIRRCRACGRSSLFIALGPDREFRICLRCRANLRYEMLGSYIREEIADLSRLDVLELDPGSPLTRILQGARSYTRSFYREHIPPGTRREDGAVCQDITGLTYANESLDLIVSSDVLEHVPNAEAAFREAARVLRPGGVHLFTVPPRPATIRRARLENGAIIHISTPEYHSDPLCESGILAFWDYGPDLGLKINTAGLTVRVVRGPEGKEQRVVWSASKLLHQHKPHVN